jgi:hypothetical protein
MQGNIKLPLFVFYTSQFKKDLDDLAKDKNCKNLSVSEILLNDFSKHLKAERSVFLFFEDIADNYYEVSKIRLKHPCKKTGKRGGVRLFFALARDSNSKFTRVVFVRLIDKKEKENLTKEEIKEALQDIIKEPFHQLLP